MGPRIHVDADLSQVAFPEGRIDPSILNDTSVFERAVLTYFFQANAVRLIDGTPVPFAVLENFENFHPCTPLEAAAWAYCLKQHPDESYAHIFERFSDALDEAGVTIDNDVAKMRKYKQALKTTKTDVSAGAMHRIFEELFGKAPPFLDNMDAFSEADLDMLEEEYADAFRALLRPTTAGAAKFVINHVFTEMCASGYFAFVNQSKPELARCFPAEMLENLATVYAIADKYRLLPEDRLETLLVPPGPRAIR